MYIGVIGNSRCDEETYLKAKKVGSLIAQKNAGLICGGRGGVMQAAAEGAAEEGGITVGILPGMNKEDANPFIKIPIATGIGQARNLIVVLNSDVVIAVGGEFGTLSEIALALKHGISVVSLGSWSLDQISADVGTEKLFFTVNTPEEAVDKAFELVDKRGSLEEIRE